jgi:hypothetical protein
MEKVMGGLFLEPATHFKSAMGVIPWVFAYFLMSLKRKND